jgi:hypothetical protein
MQGEKPGSTEAGLRAAVQPATELTGLGINDAIVTVLQDAPGTVRVISYEPGETVYHEGTEIAALSVIRRGKIKLLSYLPDGGGRELCACTNAAG